MPTWLQKGEVGQVTQSHRPEYDQKIHFLSQSVSDDGKPLTQQTFVTHFYSFKLQNGRNNHRLLYYKTK